MSQPRLLARLGPILAAVCLRLHQARLSAGLVPCTGCGDFATSLANLCNDCDNDMRADCQGRDKEERMANVRTLYRVDLGHGGLVVRATVWKKAWPPASGPAGWHPSEGAAVLAFYEQEHAALQRANLAASEARARRSLASDWLSQNAKADLSQDQQAIGPDGHPTKARELAGVLHSIQELAKRSTAEQLKDPEVRQFVNRDHARRGGTA